MSGPPRWRAERDGRPDAEAQPPAENSIYVSELERARRFCQRVLGLGLFLRDDRMSALGLPGNAVLLLILAGGSTGSTPTDGGADIPPHDGGGRVHLYLGTPRSELDAWDGHLEAQGVPVESRITWPRGGTSHYFRDPDGSLLELATPGLWPSW